MGEVDLGKVREDIEECVRLEAWGGLRMNAALLLDEIERLREALAETKKIVRWHSGETMTCWHRDGDFRVTYKGGTYDCPACNRGGSFGAKLEDTPLQSALYRGDPSGGRAPSAQQESAGDNDS